MGANCSVHRINNTTMLVDSTYRRVLWLALIINFSMFLVEIIAGFSSNSLALQADALDFLGDSGNLIITLFVLGMALKMRAKAALLKGITMACFGLWVIGSTAWSLFFGHVPDPITMGVVGVMAFTANILVLFLLLIYRDGDSNMKSVWICSRNDVIGNFAVLLAALGVFGTGTAWPDLIVASIMAVLALHGSRQIIKYAFEDMRK